ncbi:MAG: hypothetical protein IE916_02950 [Epsilonproteobacteria bacterium]|nr:hypothetical protein [Campylobacterales bacterium]MBD3823451.1 hypothetical protein [Campylobacterota bacterium]
MKKILIGLSIVTALGLSANDVMSANMKSMRDGLVEIQDGFLYNNKDGVLKGIAKIEEANKMFHDKESVAKYLPANKERLSSVALLSSKHLNSNLLEMKEYINQNQLLEASSVHSDVVRNCTRCHAIIRGW